ncbi:MAG: transporter [Lentisphaeraceae bacterium]|nr:transporter [Lentisphaeraceae bacterium]
MRTKLFLYLVLLSFSLWAEKTKQEIAKQVANPLTSLTYIPLQLDNDYNIGPDDDGERHTLNLQPLTSVALNEEWNLLSRTIIPFIDQTDISPGSGSQSGLGDILQSFFFSPNPDKEGEWIWGAGPAVLMPTATDELLGDDKWAIGPTFVTARVDGPWTVGLLANHLFSVAGDSDRPYINSTFIQPFFDYTTEGAITYELTTETSYDWREEEWSVPINLTANKLFTVGEQLFMIGGGLRYWAVDTDYDPEGFGFNISFYWLLP